MSESVVVVFSGGQDSTTCLYYALNQGYDVHAVTFDYGQRHDAEIKAAKRIAKYAGVSHEVIKLGPPRILEGTSPLVSDSELEQYDNPESLPGGLEKTFVPMRNQLFLTIAANRAYVRGGHILVTGVSAEDFGGYPDCRPQFIDALERACCLGTFTGQQDTRPPLHILTPLMYLNKAETVQLALKLEGCYEALALSHTAYDGQYPPVGNDHASVLRAKGFRDAGVPDPLVLRAHVEGRLEGFPNAPGYEHDKLLKYYESALEVANWLKENDV